MVLSAIEDELIKRLLAIIPFATASQLSQQVKKLTPQSMPLAQKG